jgi:hypothetical protein
MMSKFKSLIVGGVCAAALATGPVAHSAILNISVFDNGTLVAMAAPSTTGTATLDASSDPEFAVIGVRADGPGILPSADLSSVTLSISAAKGFTGTHVLTIDIYQTGVSISPGTVTESTFTVNNLIGKPGPTTESDYYNGTTNTLGTLLETATFPTGTTTGTAGPLASTIGAITADAEQYMITFKRPIESANDTIQLTTGVIPEPSTWAMMLLGFAGLGFVGYRKVKSRRTVLSDT